MTISKESYLYAICLLALVLFTILFWYAQHPQAEVLANLELSRSPFEYAWIGEGTIEEAGSLEETASPYWWVDSGAELTFKEGMAQTIQGALPKGNMWRTAYAQANPADTDTGLHPQNIFRLISRGTWKNFQEEMYFKITAVNLSSSPNRDESNGLLLFGRYRDSNNLYYAGLRVDGTAVIKRKEDGKYTTLAQVSLFPHQPYDRESHPNALPTNTWIGLRLEVTDPNPDTVLLNLYSDIGKSGQWKLVASATDNGTSGIPIHDTAHTGVRTDFMDVQFGPFRVERL